MDTYEVWGAGLNSEETTSKEITDILKHAYKNDKPTPAIAGMQIYAAGYRNMVKFIEELKELLDPCLIGNAYHIPEGYLDNLLIKYGISPSLLKSEKPEDVLLDAAIMPFVKGTPFRCKCGANVFTKLRRGNQDIYRCNGCQTEYIGE